VGGRFGRGDKTGADPHAIGSSRQCRSHGASCCDASGGQHGYVHCVEHAVEQGQQADPAAHVAASFDPLCDQEIATGSCGSARFLHRADLPGRQGVGSMGALDQVGIGLAEEKLDHPHPRGRDFQALAIEEGDQEIHANAAARLPGQRIELFA
jgi:hypothetical protein